MPVRYVNIDDVKSFIDWRSKRDAVTYRLPTEQEWEYAARNGSANNLYPWGDEFDEAKSARGAIWFLRRSAQNPKARTRRALWI
jgi:formylglycine-generating enzyme required for sulfatase activity